MSGDFIVLTQTPDQPLAEKRFPDFQSLVRHIEKDITPGWANTASIHVPSQVMDDERGWLRSRGLKGDF